MRTTSDVAADAGQPLAQPLDRVGPAVQAGEGLRQGLDRVGEPVDVRAEADAQPLAQLVELAGDLGQGRVVRCGEAPRPERAWATTQRSTRASRSSERRWTSVWTNIRAALRNRASSVLSKAIWRAEVTPVRFDMNPSRFLTIGRTRLMFIRALLMPSTVPMKPMTGSR